MVERFNDGEHSLFFVSLKAGGTGLNLTGADTVILYDLWWNPAVEQQAIDRAHRMGQREKVQVFRLISKGTIEEKIYRIQERKQALFDKIIQPGEQLISKLSEEDLQEILDLKTLQ
jgi:SNF2 family DNA or RNA helicase